jgi:ATP-dependent Clp protease ATP-binding subunit ClpA
LSPGDSRGLTPRSPLGSVCSRIEPDLGWGSDPGVSPKIGETVPVELRPTHRVKRIIVAAEEEATSRGHDYLGTEHLLIALADDRDGIAGRILEELGVADQAITRVREILESPGYNR